MKNIGRAFQFFGRAFPFFERAFPFFGRIFWFFGKAFQQEERLHYTSRMPEKMRPERMPKRRAEKKVSTSA